MSSEKDEESSRSRFGIIMAVGVILTILFLVFVGAGRTPAPEYQESDGLRAGFQRDLENAKRPLEEMSGWLNGTKDVGIPCFGPAISESWFDDQLRTALQMLSQGHGVLGHDSQYAFFKVSHGDLGTSEEGLSAMRERWGRLWLGLQLRYELDHLTQDRCLDTSMMDDVPMEGAIDRIHETGIAWEDLLGCSEEALGGGPWYVGYRIRAFDKTEWDLWEQVGAWHDKCTATLWDKLKLYPERGEKIRPHDYASAIRAHRHKALQMGEAKVRLTDHLVQRETRKAQLRYGKYLVRLFRKQRQELTLLFPETRERVRDIQRLHEESGIPHWEFGTSQEELLRWSGDLSNQQ